jgi:hypothetical protein
MFQPIIPLSGIGGWNFLQSTYDRQLENFADSAQIRNDREYMESKLSSPMALEDFMDDSRLLRVTMTAFDLGGEEWKRGFIDKVLTESSDPDSSFLERLNNAQYTRFAEALSPNEKGTINLSPDALTDIGNRFEAASFKVEVGEIDDNMRLGLNYQTEIGELVSASSSDEANLYRLLGSVPVRAVLESALNLPSDIANLSVEKQAEIFDEKLQSTFGIQNVSELTDPDMINRVVTRFHAIESLNGEISSSARGATALTLLTGVGSSASENMFLSLFV